jgi:hypothetical protein
MPRALVVWSAGMPCDLQKSRNQPSPQHRDSVAARACLQIALVAFTAVFGGCNGRNEESAVVQDEYRDISNEAEELPFGASIEALSFDLAACDGSLVAAVATPESTQLWLRPKERGEWKRLKTDALEPLASNGGTPRLLFRDAHSLWVLTGSRLVARVFDCAQRELSGPTEILPASEGAGSVHAVETPIGAIVAYQDQAAGVVGALRSTPNAWRLEFHETVPRGIAGPVLAVDDKSCWMAWVHRPSSPSFRAVVAWTYRAFDAPSWTPVRSDDVTAALSGGNSGLASVGDVALYVPETVLCLNVRTERLSVLCLNQKDRWEGVGALSAPEGEGVVAAESQRAWIDTRFRRSDPAAKRLLSPDDDPMWADNRLVAQRARTGGPSRSLLLSQPQSRTEFFRLRRLGQRWVAFYAARAKVGRRLDRGLTPLSAYMIDLTEK